MSVNLGNDTKATSPVRTPDEAKEGKYEPKQNKKIVRLLTVIAYVISVSMAAIILSLYYVFLWDPQLKYPDRSGSKIDTSPFTQPDTGEAGMAADSGMMESQPTPKALPVYPEPNYQHSAYQTQHHDGQTSSQFNNNHQSPGPSPQQGIPRDASSPTGSPFVSDDIRQQQQHGQPPLSASA